jgi:hypothetical protein
MNEQTNIEEYALPQTKVVETDPKYGPVREVTIRRFAAFEGWKMKTSALDYAKSDSEDFRSYFTLKVLSTAMADGKSLDKEDTVNDTLGHWRNIEVIFNAILEFNEIDTAVSEEAAREWIQAGASMADAFAFEMGKLMGPAFDMFNKEVK